MSDVLDLQNKQDAFGLEIVIEDPVGDNIKPYVDGEVTALTGCESLELVFKVGDVNKIYINEEPYLVKWGKVELTLHRMIDSPPDPQPIDVDI